MGVGMIGKKCGGCKQIKLANDFNKDIGKHDGLQSYCKTCHQKHNKNYSKSEKRKKYHQQYYKKYMPQYIHRPHVKERLKEYYVSGNGREARLRAHKRYAQTEKGKKALKDGAKRYYQTEKGKLALLRHYNKRRNMKTILLMTNPFPEEIDVDYHHIDGRVFVIPLPRCIHNSIGGKQHIEKNNEQIEMIYGLNVENLLNEAKL